MFLDRKGVTTVKESNNIIYESCKCPVQDNETVLEYLNLLNNYMQVPYTVDEKMIKLFDSVKEVNLRRIEVLKAGGIDYDL